MMAVTSNREITIMKADNTFHFYLRRFCMKNRASRYLLGLALVLLVSCSEKKIEPSKIDGMDTYTDASCGMSVHYPKNWTVKKSSGERFLVLSNPETESRFLDFKEGAAGAKLDVKIASLKDMTLDQFIAEDKIFSAEAYAPVEKATLGGQEATKLSFSADAQDGKFKGFKYYTLKDTVLTTLEFSAFGGTYEAYAPQIDEIIKTFTCAGPTKQKEAKIDTVKKEPEPPSQNLVSAPGNGYTISIPDNFRAKGVKASGAIGGSQYLGDRLDCTIQVDIIDAAKQSNLDKIANENKAQFGGSSQKATTLGGQKAYMFSYSPAAGIGRNAYLCVKDARLYRVFVTWNKAEEDKYLPVFNKCISSFQFK